MIKRTLRRLGTSAVLVLPMGGLVCAGTELLAPAISGATSGTLTFSSTNVITVTIDPSGLDLQIPVSLSGDVTGVISGAGVFTSNEEYELLGSVVESGVTTYFDAYIPSGDLLATDDGTTGTGNVYDLKMSGGYATLSGAGSPFSGCDVNGITNGNGASSDLDFTDTVDVSAPYNLQENPNNPTDVSASVPSTPTCTGQATLDSQVAGGVSVSTAPGAGIEATVS